MKSVGFRSRPVSCDSPPAFRVFQVRAEITSKEKEEEDMMEKVQKEAK